MAIDMGGLEVAERILRQDPAQSRMRFGTGLTLLHDSARVGDSRIEAMALLLQFGADVDATTNWDATALHLAVFHGGAQAVRFLLQQGASPDLRDNRGLTPLELAEAKGREECAAALRDHLAAIGRVAGASFLRFPALADRAPDENDALGAPRVTFAADADAGDHGIDDFYQALGRDERVPHPMDEDAAALLFEELRKARKSP